MKKEKLTTLKNELLQIKDSKVEVENVNYIPSENEISKKSKVKNLQCSIMFVDMRNSTKMQDTTGRKNMVKIYKMFARLVVKAVEDWGGKVMQIVGDGMLCLFINDNENSGQNAVNAYISTNTYIKNVYNKIVDDDWAIECGFGICSGHLYITKTGVRGKDKCAQVVYPSSITNYASKFCDLAHGGSLLLDEETYKQLDKETKNEIKKINTKEYGIAYCMENISWQIA